MYVYIYIYIYVYIHKCWLRVSSHVAILFFRRERHTRCAVLQFRILLSRKSKWASESLRGYPHFRSGTCDNICYEPMLR